MPVTMLPQKHVSGRMLLALKSWGFAPCSPLVAQVWALWVPRGFRHPHAPPCSPAKLGGKVQAGQRAGEQEQAYSTLLSKAS